LFPATASLVQHRFGLNAGAFDLLAACPGWLYAVSAAKAYVESGQSKKVLAIGAEALTKLINWEDRSTAVLFGDGAGAVIIEPVEAPYGIAPMVLGSDGGGGGLLHAGAIGRCLPDGTNLTDKLFMNGREVYKFAVRVMDTATLEAIEKAGLVPDDIELFVPHQARGRDGGRVWQQLHGEHSARHDACARRRSHEGWRPHSARQLRWRVKLGGWGPHVGWGSLPEPCAGRVIR